MAKAQYSSSFKTAFYIGYQCISLANDFYTNIVDDLRLSEAIASKISEGKRREKYKQIHKTAFQKCLIS